MDPSYDLNISNQISPRRMIETTKSVTPGGTLVTTTTTTTHRPQNHRIDANVDSKFFSGFKFWKILCMYNGDQTWFSLH